jgi:hypothetical protein
MKKETIFTIQLRNGPSNAWNPASCLRWDAPGIDDLGDVFVIDPMVKFVKATILGFFLLEFLLLRLESGLAFGLNFRPQCLMSI